MNNGSYYGKMNDMGTRTPLNNVQNNPNMYPMNQGKSPNQFGMYPNNNMSYGYNNQYY
jgi:hypothetical protein